jgi:hypothetical protein
MLTPGEFRQRRRRVSIRGKKGGTLTAWPWVVSSQKIVAGLLFRVVPPKQITGKTHPVEYADPV